MAELRREIESEDIPKLKVLLQKVFGNDQYANIQRLGGMTNHSYKVTLLNGAEYLLRIPGEGTEELIIRSDERKSTELACRLGIDSELLYFDNEGFKVMRFIDNPQLMTNDLMCKEPVIKQAADIFNKLHNCGENTGVEFDVFNMAALYEKFILEKGVSLYDDYDNVKQSVIGIKNSIDSINPDRRVPCHNDSLLENWVLDGSGKLFLVDWEYSGMNESMWDLSCLSIEIGYNSDQDTLLLEGYFQREPSAQERQRFIASKLYVDYLWTLWGLTRVPFDGDFMQEYADNRYHRLKSNLSIYSNSAF